MAQMKQASQNYKNILLIIGDCVRYDRLSCYGYNKETTPNLDKLAKESTIFEQAASQAVWTLPSHATIFTGLYPSEHERLRGSKNSNIFLPKNIKTLGEILKQHGYSTAGFSNNPWVGKISDLNRGFDFFWESNMDFSSNSSFVPSIPFTLKSLNRLGKLTNRVRIRSLISYLISKPTFTKAMRKAMEEWIALQASSHLPFFIFANFMDAHQPYHPPKNNLRRICDRNTIKTNSMKLNWKIRKYFRGELELDDELFKFMNDYYDASLNFLDGELGKLFDFLKQENLLDKTLVIFTADHGKNLGDYDINDLLHNVRDSIIRVPLIIRCPELLPSGKRCEEEVEIIDIFYTILSLLKINQNPNLPKKSSKRLSLFDVLQGLNANRNFSFSEALLPYTTDDQEIDSVKCIRTKKWKYISSQRRGDIFFNLREDPKEKNELYEVNPQESVNLKKILQDKLDSLDLVSGEQDENKKVDELDEAVIQRLKNLGYLD
jgi:arylsulfatase A-like enzyme